MWNRSRSMQRTSARCLSTQKFTRKPQTNANTRSIAPPPPPPPPPPTMTPVAQHLASSTPQTPVSPPPAPHNVPPQRSNAPSAPAGTDYLTMFRSNRGALTKFGSYTAGKIAKLRVSKYALKNDIVNHFRGCNLKPENVKFVYNSFFKPDYVQLDCDSHASFAMLEKFLDMNNARLGFRRLRLESAPPMPWNIVDAYLRGVPRGRTLVMINLAQNVTVEDLERFFEGYNYDPSCANFFTLPREQAGRKMMFKHGVIAFTTQLEALRARREKNGEMCLNKKVALRLLQ